jgi:Protein of unknown function (DUF3684)
MPVDLARLREQTIGSNVDEEAVTVNTRALIDKVLARYSGEWTTFRELIQNAADASASKVVIRFETLPSKTVPLPHQADQAALLNHTMSHHSIHRLVISNDGQHFAESDWARLKRIAEGNPDETKIGAFGVGFYSVFADCEEPFVISGRKTMAFIWKGNSLFTKASTLSQDQASQETSFLLNYRNTTSSIPDLMSICQFLCTSLTFVNLQRIELWIDQWNILQLQKKSAPGLDAQLPSDINPRTKEGLMKITGVTHQSTQIDAKWLNVVAKPKSKGSSTSNVANQEEDTPVLAVKSFFSKIAAHTIQNTAAKRAQREREAEAERQIIQNLTASSQGTVFLRISTVKIQTSITSTFAAELERATKKPPPKSTKIAILTSSYDEASATQSNFSGITGDKAELLFSSVLPTKHGRVFIGFPTAQTTGMLCHISAPSVIPTVERESIDLNARYVKTWNTEMLRVAGIACRIAYGGNMQDLKQRLDSHLKSQNKSSPKPDDISTFIPQAAHISHQFCAKESTPSLYVGQLIEEAFWDCSKRSTIEVLSTKGVLPSHQVRVVTEHLSFLENIPVIPSTLAKSSEDFIRRLYEKSLINDLTVVDVRKQLDSQSLSESQMIEFLKYLAAQASTNMDISTVQILLNAAVGMVENDNSANGKGQMVALSQIKTFLVASKIPPTMPVPQHTIPFKLTKNLSMKDLSLFGWEELQMVPWLRFLIEGPSRSELTSENDITRSPQFAINVLHVLSKQWDHINQASRSIILELLSNKAVIPTKLGLRKPSEAYFTTVKLFDDLPTVVSELNVKEKVLVALGVRKTIELSVVFERLMSSSQKLDGSTKPKWSFTDLIRYLVSVRGDIPTGDINRLRSAAICPVVAQKSEQAIPGVLVAITQIYEPLESLKGLNLPILYWPGEYNANGAEAQFMKFLGLKSSPSTQELVNLMAASAKERNIKLYQDALTYYLVNFEKNRYSIAPGSELSSVAFLPVEGSAFPVVVAPKACYANERASILGYRILKASMKQHASKFGVEQDPSMNECISCLIGNPPITHRDAVETFGYLGSRLVEINDALAATAGAANIVPIKSKAKNESTKMTSPRMCFLGDSSTYGEILDFVDFGQAANLFLLKVGSKQEPTTNELAYLIKDSPAKVLSVLGQDRYLDLLRRLAEQQKALKQDTGLWKQLRVSPFLLAYRDTRVKDTGALKDGADAYDDDNFMQMASLRPASQIVVNDNYREFILFREHVHCAPPDDALERFYLALGVPSLQSLLVLDERVGGIRRDQSAAAPLKKLIVERCRLFLHEYSQDVVHDAKWLEKNLAVVVADSLSLTTSLKGYRVPPFRENKTAILSQNKKECILFIVTRPDLYEVSRCIIPLLLSRPKQHDVLALEMVLDSDLRRLRNKGYNVDRILRQQERQASIAEEESRKQQAEEERQAALRDQQKRKEKEFAPLPAPPAYTAEAEDERSLLMPGGFEPDSPPRPPPKQKSLLSQVGDWSRQFATGVSEPPTSSTTPSQLNNNSLQEPQPDKDVVNSDRRVAANLQNAIQACRSHTSSSVFSPPTTSVVQEAQGSYCDSTPAQNLVHVSSTAGGIKFFLAKNLVSQSTSLQQLHQKGLDSFSYLLLDLASIFSLPAQDLHMFLDPDSSSIAFNLNGALFFNYHYFEKLHSQTWRTSKDKTIDAIAYWWVTLCHELAHNLSKTHSAEHSFYTESFASQFFSKAMHKALQY